MGVMMLATLGLTEGGDYHRLNALKNLLSIVIAAVAIVVFVSGGVVAWLQALVMVPGVALGGYAGVWTAKRVPQDSRARLRRRGRPVPGGLLFRHGLSDFVANRSGRRSAVSFSASARRHSAILAWLPEVSTSGIGRPSNSCGRV